MERRKMKSLFFFLQDIAKCTKSKENKLSRLQKNQQDFQSSEKQWEEGKDTGAKLNKFFVVVLPCDSNFTW